MEKNEFKGTKGKWEVCEHSWSDSSIICGDKTIFEKSIYDDAIEETQEQLEDEVSANFKLMCASKELLDICIDFVEKVERGEARSVRTYGKMKEVIAKVLGE